MKHVALKVIASHTEEQIITSDPSQVLAIEKSKKDLLQSESASAEAQKKKIRKGTH